MKWALVNNQTNIVENIVIWDGNGELFPHTTNVHLNDNERCGISWTYDVNNDPRFIEPEVQKISEPEEQEIP